MSYMQQLSDGRVVPQTSLPEWMWRGKPKKPEKRKSRGGKQTFRVEVTESFHDSFDVEAENEQEARKIVDAKLDSEDLTCRHGEYDRTINHAYPVG